MDRVKLTEAQTRRKIKSIYKRWLEDEKFFHEIAVRPVAEFSDVNEVLRNLGSAIAFAQSMIVRPASNAKKGSRMAETPGRLELIELFKYDFPEVYAIYRPENILNWFFDRLAAKSADDGLYLVWSNQHRAWWRPESAGYTDNVISAGRYSRADAIGISFRGRDGWDSPKGVPDELAIAERDVPAFTAALSPKAMSTHFHDYDSVEGQWTACGRYFAKITCLSG